MGNAVERYRQPCDRVAEPRNIQGRRVRRRNATSPARRNDYRDRRRIGQNNTRTRPSNVTVAYVIDRNRLAARRGIERGGEGSEPVNETAVRR